MRRFPVLLLILFAATAIAETTNPAPPGLVIQTRPALRQEPNNAFEARSVLLAFERAYPRSVSEVAWRNGEWAIRVAEEWFYWAGGRLLPEDAREEADRYDPHPFYRYRTGPYVAPVYTQVERAALETRAAELDASPPRRHPGFLNALWRIDGRASSWDRQKTTFFLGLKTMVHRDLLEDLAAVEEQIMEAARTDSELADFVDRLASIEGYNYRRVDGTATLSNHSFGIAVDFIPRSYAGRQVYWRWARDGRVDWLGLDDGDRFAIPAAFVAAFEAHGFVWGGKWAFFDIMHFEYRPEILILNGYEVDLR